MTSPSLDQNFMLCACLGAHIQQDWHCQLIAIPIDDSGLIASNSMRRTRRSTSTCLADTCWILNMAFDFQRGCDACRPSSPRLLHAHPQPLPAWIRPYCGREVQHWKHTRFWQRQSVHKMALGYDLHRCGRAERLKDESEEHRD